MKVLIVSVADFRHMTPASFYVNYLLSNQIDYQILCMDRYGTSATSGDNVYQYRNVGLTNKHKITKLIAFLGFRRFFKKAIRQNSYDFVVVWNENTALLLFDILLRKFHGRFCVNIRDSVDDLGVLKCLVLLVLRKSVFNTIPSPAVVSYYPRNTLVMVNYDYRVVEGGNQKLNLRNIMPIRIIYMGLIYQWLDPLKGIIDAFGNDQRFHLYFYGDGADIVLKKYATDRCYANITTGGAFLPTQTSELLKNADVINTFYGFGKIDRNALGIKDSYGPFLNMPELVNAGTYWDEISTMLGFGFPVKNLSTLADEFFAWYSSLQFNEMSLGCKIFCNYARKKNAEIVKILDQVLLGRPSLQKI